MFGFLNRAKLKKDDLKGSAKLMYQDVSEDSWDKENFTKRNLDFTIKSVRYIDMYTKRLMNTKFGTELLNKHFDNLVVRIGAYIGEVIKNNIKQDFYWYESDSVHNYSPNLDGVYSNTKTQSVLYSKKRDIVILPLNMVSQFLKGNHHTLISLLM
ncbi:hypothetical protein [Peribacillus asahii]|uniref:hypothetical protein n=1 Tax=Peribacillus asahii TaxID=228899 RepID=UPI0038075A5D